MPISYSSPLCRCQRLSHCTSVLPSHFVVGSLAVLRCRPAGLDEIGSLVDPVLWNIILHPTNVPQVPDAHVQALEREAPIDDAIQLAGFDLCVKQRP